MHIKKFKIFLLSVIMLLSLSIFSGCMDMGTFETDEDYYNSFGTITLYNETGTTSTYDLKSDFYNEETIENKTNVPQDNYVYFCIEILRDMEIHEFAMYEKTETSVNAEYSFFILKALPSVVPSYDSALPVLEESDPFLTPVTTAKHSLNNGIWDCFSVNKIGKVDENGKECVKEGDILCIRFDNNTCYGKEKGLKKVAFCLTNFMVRATY